jgi:hypothetical protein
MNRSELLRLAQVGAQARLNILKTEIQDIYRQFPALRSGRSGGTAVVGAGAPSRRGRRRKMSAAERRAVSERMTKYWAARRKAKKAS